MEYKEVKKRADYLFNKVGFGSDWWRGVLIKENEVGYYIEVMVAYDTCDLPKEIDGIKIISRVVGYSLPEAS